MCAIFLFTCNTLAQYQNKQKTANKLKIKINHFVDCASSRCSIDDLRVCVTYNFNEKINAFVDIFNELNTNTLRATVTF